MTTNEQMAEVARIAAQALRDAAEELGDCATLPELDDEPVFAIMIWLRERADALSIPPGRDIQR